jgi:Zn-dependent protease
MRFRWTWKICRIAGITISVHPSWLVIYALFAYSGTLLARLVSPELNHAGTLVLGLGAALVLFASVIAHEFAHALVARRLGIPIGGITLFLFGGVATILREPKKPADELKMALAGPALSALLAALFTGLYFAAAGVNWLWGATFCLFLAFSNALVAAFNLLPAFPSDGGRVLRSLLWMLQPSQARATVWASTVSVVVAAGLIVAGVYFVFDFHVARGWWWVLVGAFLAQAAVATGRTARVDLALERMSARDCMLKTLVPVPAQASVAAFMGEVTGLSHTAYPVVDRGRLVGFADVRAGAGIPVPLWHDTPVSAIMTPVKDTVALTGGESARDVLNKLAEHRVRELPVYEGGELVGIVTQDSIFRALHAQRAA